MHGNASIASTWRRPVLMPLAELLAPTPATDFLAGYYLKLPFASRGGCRHLTRLGDWPAVERLLADPAADARASRHGQLWDGGPLGAPGLARELLAQGYTLGVRHAERNDPGLAGLAAGFRDDFLAPIDIHLYCTPAREAGLGWHYDA